MTNIFLQETLGALQATISVLLVLGYGAAATGWLKMMPSEVVNGMTKVGTNIFLPCLLFTQMGKEASVSQLKEYWILPVFNLAFTLLALLYAWIGVRFLRLPNWLFPAAAFPNTLSLPLLLLESLSKTGAVDELLMGKKDTVEAALGRGKTYMLVNGLAGNILRFALGPKLMKPDEGDGEDKKKKDNRGLTDPERQPLLADVRPGEPVPSLNGEADGGAGNGGGSGNVGRTAKKAAYEIKEFFNPPLIAGIIAIIIGAIPPTHKLFFEEGGALNASFTQSITTIGKLYTGLQMFVLGGKLVSKKGGRARILPLLYLFAYRFFIVPATSISLVYLLRSHFPHYIKADPMLDFVLAISHVGPPAITLAALAQVSGMDEEEQGVVATVLLASYVVTPLISLSVSFTMTAIGKLY